VLDLFEDDLTWVHSISFLDWPFFRPAGQRPAAWLIGSSA
jgi:hypothetical protein